MKKFLALMMAALMSVSVLAGCGNNDSTGGNDSTDGAATLKIGCAGPFTGGAAAYGLAVKNGAQLAVDEINAAGGVNGLQLELNAQDDEHDAEKAVNAYNNLKDWGMQVFIGTTTSTPCKAVLPETVTDNMFMLTPSASAVEAIDAPNAFRVCFSNPNQGAASAEYMAANNLGEKIAVIYNSSDVYSTGIYETFNAKATELGLNVVAAEAFTDDSKTDFSVQLQKAETAGADLIFLPIYYQKAALVFQQADSKGYEPDFFSCDGLDGILGLENFDTSLAEGAMLLTPFVADATDDKTVAFVTAYKAAYNNETPIQFAADAYDAVYIIKSALEQAAVTDASISASDLCELLKTAMTEITFEGLTGTITWDADGEPTKDPKAMVIENGTYTAMNK